MCVPLGLLLPFVWKAYRKFRVTVLSGAGFSALIEVSQLLTTRATDIDDLIANTLGTAVGFAVWFAFAKLFGQRMKTTVDGSKEAWIYIAISFCGMFFLGKSKDIIKYICLSFISF